MEQVLKSVAPRMRCCASTRRAISCCWPARGRDLQSMTRRHRPVRRRLDARHVVCVLPGRRGRPQRGRAGAGHGLRQRHRKPLQGLGAVRAEPAPAGRAGDLVASRVSAPRRRLDRAACSRPAGRTNASCSHTRCAIARRACWRSCCGGSTAPSRRAGGTAARDADRRRRCDRRRRPATRYPRLGRPLAVLVGRAGRRFPLRRHGGGARPAAARRRCWSTRAGRVHPAGCDRKPGGLAGRPHAGAGGSPAVRGARRARHASRQRSAARCARPISVVPDDANRMLLITATRDEYKRIVGILDRIDVRCRSGAAGSDDRRGHPQRRPAARPEWFFENGKSEFTLHRQRARRDRADVPGLLVFLQLANIQVVLDALSTVTDVNIVSSPTLTVLDGQRAVLQVGDEVPIITQQAVAVITPGAPVVNSVHLSQHGRHPGDRSARQRERPRGARDRAGGQRGRRHHVVEHQLAHVPATPHQDHGGGQDGESLALGGMMQDRSTLARDQMPIVGEIPGSGTCSRSRTTASGGPNC